MKLRTVFVLLLGLVPGTASAICRVVEPPRDGPDPGVAFDPSTSALYVLAPDQLVDVRCDDGSAAEPGAGDSWVCLAGEPSLTHDTLVSLVVQPAIVARGGSAGLVMPVPARPDVAAGEPSLVHAASALAVAQVEETVYVHEDPGLGFQCSDPHYSAVTPADIPLAMWGCGEYYRAGTERRETETIDYGDAGQVDLETIETSDAYDVTALSASSLEALSAWMDDNGFAHDSTDDEAFGAYVGDDRWFVAVHVHPENLGGARRELAPIVVTWRGAELPLTHRLQYDPNGGVITTDAWVLAPTRMDAPGDVGFTLYAAPTSFEGTAVAGFGLAEGWLTHIEMTRVSNRWLEDDVLLEGPPDIVRPTLRRERHAYIAAPCCPGGRRAVTDPEAFVTHAYERSYLATEDPPVPAEWLGSTAPPGAEWCGGETFGCAGSERRTDLRGCAATGASLRAVVWGWGPIALALLVFIGRGQSRRRRRGERPRSRPARRGGLHPGPGDA